MVASENVELQIHTQAVNTSKVIIIFVSADIEASDLTK